jgi:hypothetical protein
MVSMNTNTLEKALIGLVMIFAIITVFGTLATPIALAIANVTSSSLGGVAVFSVVGMLITIGILVMVMRGLMGGGKR